MAQHSNVVYGLVKALGRLGLILGYQLVGCPRVFLSMSMDSTMLIPWLRYATDLILYNMTCICHVFHACTSNFVGSSMS